MPTTNENVPLRLGFWLGYTGLACAAAPWIPYCGIDRLPADLDFDENSPLPGDPEWSPSVWDRYDEAEERGDLNCILSVARQLQTTFRGDGLDLDVIYAEVTFIPADIEQYPSGELWSETLAFVLPARQGVHERLRERPAHLQFLGYDLSFPAPTFHSAIYQPGLSQSRPDFPEHLNNYGLFSDHDVALEFLAAANDMDYGPMPFCLIGIWAPAAL